MTVGLQQPLLSLPIHSVDPLGKLISESYVNGKITLEVDTSATFGRLDAVARFFKLVDLDGHPMESTRLSMVQTLLKGPAVPQNQIGLTIEAGFCQGFDLALCRAGGIRWSSTNPQGSVSGGSGSTYGASNANIRNAFHRATSYYHTLSLTGAARWAQGSTSAMSASGANNNVTERSGTLTYDGSTEIYLVVLAFCSVIGVSTTTPKVTFEVSSSALPSIPLGF